MTDFFTGHYNVWRGLHIIAVIAWMAGIMYLPRLYVYHADAKPGSELDETFKVMERRLYYGIMAPAQVVTFLFGLLLIYVDGVTLGWDFLIQPAMIVKIIGIFVITGFHGFLGTTRRQFAAGTNTRPAKFFRQINEIPFVAAIIMVLAVTVWVRAAG
jgi:putative membrane protein